MDRRNYYKERQFAGDASIRRILIRDPKTSIKKERVSVRNSDEADGKFTVERDIYIPKVRIQDNPAFEASYVKRRMELENEAYETYLAAIGKLKPSRNRGYDEITEEYRSRQERSKLAADIRAAAYKVWGSY